ncbi:MAG TPA: TniQ family protein [Gallionellaceae bacterium]|nr:TniQ family protein [Gallionellaceae bacterium]
MVATYTWHPGSDSVNSQWVITVPLMQDEVISSWLVRAALTQGCDPLVLSGQLWPKWRIWTGDADRFFTDERIKHLSKVSGIPTEALRAATLCSVASQIFGGTLPDKMMWPWMLALGARNTKRRSGLQYCPACLAEDAKPYYRLQWRFAWHTGCEWHNVLLRDRCHACKAPVEPHRLLAEDRSIVICATCKADLRDASISPWATEASAFQCMADHVVCQNQGMFQGHAVVASEWFELACFFVRLLRRANHSGIEALRNFIDRLGSTLPGSFPVASELRIELLQTQERQKLIGSFYPLMLTNKKRFENALIESGITLQGFCEKDESLPQMLQWVTSFLPDKPRSRTPRSERTLTAPRPRHEVMRMMAKLQRRLEMLQR